MRNWFYSATILSRPISLSCYTSIGFQRSTLDYPWIQCPLNEVVLHCIIDQVCSVFADHNLFCHSFINLIQCPLLCTYKIINVTVSPIGEIYLPPIIPAKVHAPILIVIAWIGEALINWFLKSLLTSRT